MQKHVNLVDLVKSFPKNIFLQNLASIQKRTRPIKFAHLAEKSKNGSIPSLSTKDETAAAPVRKSCRSLSVIAEAAERPIAQNEDSSAARAHTPTPEPPFLRSEVNNSQ